MFGMTLYTWVVIIGYGLWPVIGVAAMTIGSYTTREKAYEDGRADAYDGILDRHVIEPDPELELEPIAELSPGRHARTQPRQQAAAPPVQAGQDQRPPWYTQIPGPDHPQPGRDSGPGTARLPRFGSIAYALEAAGVRPRLGLPATTGELAAVNDEYIARMQAEEEADRQARAQAMREELETA
jgi:hypothetical protein